MGLKIRELVDRPIEGTLRLRIYSLPGSQWLSWPRSTRAGRLSSSLMDKLLR